MAKSRTKNLVFESRLHVFVLTKLPYTKDVFIIALYQRYHTTKVFATLAVGVLNVPPD